MKFTIHEGLVTDKFFWYNYFGKVCLHIFTENTLFFNFENIFSYFPRKLENIRNVFKLFPNFPCIFVVYFSYLDRYFHRYIFGAKSSQLQLRILFLVNSTIVNNTILNG